MACSMLAMQTYLPLTSALHALSTVTLSQPLSALRCSPVPIYYVCGNYIAYRSGA